MDDFQAFLEAVSKPLPRVVWTNRLKTTPEGAQSWIGARCPEAEPIAWHPGAWRIPPEYSPGKWLEFVLGLVHCQEEISLLPVLALDPRPGETILDLCAAPGGKTAFAGVRMRDRGRIVANDLNWRRIKALRNVQDRLGLTCVAVTRESGTEMPGRSLYDRVLLDAPCSCEGITRKITRWTQKRSPDDWLKLRDLQRRLLERAVELVRPGGVIVYSTCTYAPEENEAVLSTIKPEEASIEPVCTPSGLRGEPGLAGWKGEPFRRDVSNALRFWPHHNDTGGFFVARLRRF